MSRPADVSARSGVVIEAPTIGEAWLGVAAHILRAGEPERYDGLPILELAHVTLVVAAPDADDPLIARYGDPERLRWMRANFAAYDRVEALGGARSYASRLFDYASSGRDRCSASSPTAVSTRRAGATTGTAASAGSPPASPPTPLGARAP
jgi:hypothetical protein